MPTAPVLTVDQRAEEVYDAYGATTDHKNYQGLPMPAWSDLPPKIQDAWRAAARKCHDTVAAWVKATTPPPSSFDPFA